MVDPLLLAGGGALVGFVLGLGVGRFRRSGDERQSRQAHERAQERKPPVDIGETYELCVTEFTDHHSGDRDAVTKKEGFVVFVKEIPSDLSTGDMIEARIVSYNEGETSAEATHVETI